MRVRSEAGELRPIDQYADMTEQRAIFYTKSGRTFTVGITYAF